MSILSMAMAWEQHIAESERACRECYRYRNGNCIPTVNDIVFADVDEDAEGVWVDGSDYMCEEGRKSW